MPIICVFHRKVYLEILLNIPFHFLKFRCYLFLFSIKFPSLGLIKRKFFIQYFDIQWYTWIYEINLCHQKKCKRLRLDCICYIFYVDEKQNGAQYTCGTPHKGFLNLENVLPILTHRILFFRCDLKKSHASPACHSVLVVITKCCGL